MEASARCHDFAQMKEFSEADVENLGKEHDAEMGENSCQPFGLQPKFAPYCVGRLDRILDTLSASSLSSTTLARNAHAPHYVRDSGMPR